MTLEKTQKNSTSYLVSLLEKSGFTKSGECESTGNCCTYYVNRQRSTKPHGVIISVPKSSTIPKIIIHGKGERLEDAKKLSMEVFPCDVFAEGNLQLPGQLDYEEINQRSLVKLLQEG